MALIKGKFIEDDAIKGDKVKLENNQALRGRNNGDTADIEIAKVNASDEIELASVPVVGADALESTANKGQANGYAPLNGSSLIDAVYLPSFVDDVEEYADFASLPATGETGKIYVTLNDNKTFRWSGSAYIEISPSEVESVNGNTGIVVLDTDDIGEGATNLYFTDVRVEDATLTNYVLGTDTPIANTDDVKGAFGKLQAQINNVAGSVATPQTPEVFTLSATDITNQYVTLSQVPTELIMFSINGVVQTFGVDYEVDAVNTDRVNFLGDVATLAASGDVVQISYTA